MQLLCQHLTQIVNAVYHTLVVMLCGMRAATDQRREVPSYPLWTQRDKNRRNCRLCWRSDVNTALDLSSQNTRPRLRISDKQTIIQ